jgi:tetratricopeptide (TPR) repeat protein
MYDKKLCPLMLALLCMLVLVAGCSGASPTATAIARGDTHADQGDYDAALADYTQAIELQRDNDVAYFRRANTKGLKNNYASQGADEEPTMSTNHLSRSARRSRCASTCCIACLVSLTPVS